MNDIVRIGKIGKIDYATGMASVIYTDRNNEASPEYPFFSNVYEMPKIDDTVVVLMLPNSSTKGFILGVPFSGSKIPAESGQGIFYKEFSDGTSILYDPRTKTMDISAKEIVLKKLTADSVIVDGTLKAKTIEAESATFGNLTVSSTATINNLSMPENFSNG